MLEMVQQEVEELFFLNCYVMVGGDQIPEPTYYRATNFTQTPKKKKNEFWNCHLAMLGRVAKPAQYLQVYAPVSL